MVKVYSAANLQDAHILLGLLNAAGVDARILNANAHGGLGEIPFASTYPEIWLVRNGDMPQAKHVIEMFERPLTGGAPTRCARCDEENPAGFEICWNCEGPTAA